MLLRPYQPADFAALYAVEEICFQPPFRFSRAHMRRIVSSRDAATWIAEEGSELVGFAAVEWMQGQDGLRAYIETIEVHPAWRGRSAGAGLLRHVEDSARAAGAKIIGLHVDAENAAAIRLYEGRGYTRRGREENYYARNRAALVYAKAL